jgi:uncharacterized membrane protein YidH (DUF202 family)
MGIGLGILLLVVGAILYWAVDVNIPGVNDDTLGVILMVVGVLAIVLALIQTQQLTRRRNTTVVDDRREPPAY